MAKKESFSDSHGTKTISSGLNGVQFTQGSGPFQLTLKNKQSNFMNKVMERIDLDALTDTLAEQIGQRLFERINISALAEQMYGEDLQDGITAASILQSL